MRFAAHHFREKIRNISVIQRNRSNQISAAMVWSRIKVAALVATTIFVIEKDKDADLQTTASFRRHLLEKRG